MYREHDVLHHTSQTLTGRLLLFLGWNHRNETQSVKPRIENLKISEPATRQKGVMVADVAELVKKLKYEAKVI